MATYRHKSVMRYQVIAGTADHPKKFQFDNFILKIRNPIDDEIFLKAVEGLPQRESRQIVQVNEAAESALERPISRAIHGFADSASNLSGVKGAEGLRTIGKDEGLIGGQGAGLGQTVIQGQEGVEQTLDPQNPPAATESPATPASTKPAVNPLFKRL